MTKEKEVIHVGLYGGKGIFGGRETPLEASVISCSMKDKCSLYKEGQCAAVRSVSSSGCKYGDETVKRGYTSRAMKYHQFRSKWENHERYGALESNSKGLAVIGDEVYFSYPFISVRVDEDNVSINSPTFGFGNDVAYIPLDRFTIDLIKKICEFRPQAMMGGEIKDFQNKKVPLFLSHLKETMPDLYDEFVREYTEYDKDIDYTGRKAYLHTLKSGVLRINDTYWDWDGRFLLYNKGYLPKTFIVPSGMKGNIEIIKISPEKDATVMVTNNDQVTENTKFAD